MRTAVITSVLVAFFVLFAAGAGHDVRVGHVQDVILLFAYSPYSRQSIEATEFALSRGARLVMMTDSKAAPLSAKASVVLLQSTSSPQFFPSMVSVVMCLETLVAIIVARKGAPAVASIRDFESIRTDKYINH